MPEISWLRFARGGIGPYFRISTQKLTSVPPSTPRFALDARCTPERIGQAVNRRHFVPPNVKYLINNLKGLQLDSAPIGVRTPRRNTLRAAATPFWLSLTGATRMRSRTILLSSIRSCLVITGSKPSTLRSQSSTSCPRGPKDSMTCLRKAATKLALTG